MREDFKLGHYQPATLRETRKQRGEGRVEIKEGQGFYTR